MTYQEVSSLIARIGVPYAYYQFDEDTAKPTPFVCFYYPEEDEFYADNRNYIKLVVLRIELYTDEKDFSLEETIENLLNENELPFTHYESYIDSEKMLMQTYETEVYINARN